VEEKDRDVIVQDGDAGRDWGFWKRGRHNSR